MSQSGNQFITVTGARQNNLKDVTLRIPKGRLTVFTGVSGSGTYSVVLDTIAVESQRQLNETFTWFVRNRLPTPVATVHRRPPGRRGRRPAVHRDLRAVHPATYLGVMDTVRKIFARETGADPGLFSFNSSGACATGEGRGVVHTDLASWTR